MKRLLLLILSVLTIFCSALVVSCKTEGSNEEFTFYEFSDYCGVSLNKLKSKNVVIPSEHDGLPVLSIMDNGFANSEVQTVSIPDSILLIGKNAFFNCDNLTTVKFGTGSKLDRIKEYAFADCDSLAGIDLPQKVKFIERNAFFSCDTLADIDLSTVTGYLGTGNGREESKIGDYAFAYCPKLTEVTVKAINVGNFAFYGSGIQKLTLSSEVLSLGLNVFGQCNSLREMTIAFIGGKKTGQEYIGYLFGAGSFVNNPIYTPHSLKKITINGSRAIYSGAFYNLGITDIVILNTVTRINDEAFYGCSNLKNITLGNTQEIGDRAFMNCTSLTNISISETVTQIGKQAFSGCTNLATVTINGLWQVSDTSGGEKTDIDVTSATYNASLLTGENANKYWYKKTA